MPDSRPRRPLTALGALTTAGALLLLAWWVRRTGLAEIRAGFVQIGWGLLAIVLLGGLRFAIRAGAWMLCVERPDHLAFREAFGAVLAGDALGNLLPLGPLVSEPTKVAFVRGRIAITPAVTALAIENLFYTLSVAAMIAAGMAALLFVFDLPLALRELSTIAIGLVVALFLIVVALAWTRPAVLGRAATLIPAALKGPLRLQQLAALEHQIYSFAGRRGGTVIPLIGAEVTFHCLGVLEAYVTLWLLLGAPPPVVTAFIVEAVNRLITVIFKFVPMGAGVNEAGTALLTGILGLDPTIGTTVGLVRKVRLLCWTAVGTTLLIRRGLSAGQILADPQLNKDSA